MNCAPQRRPRFYPSRPRRVIGAERRFCGWTAGSPGRCAPRRNPWTAWMRPWHYITFYLKNTSFWVCTHR